MAVAVLSLAVLSYWRLKREAPRSSKGDMSGRTPRAAEFAPTSPRGLSKEAGLTGKSVTIQGEYQGKCSPDLFSRRRMEGHTRPELILTLEA